MRDRYWRVLNIRVEFFEAFATLERPPYIPREVMHTSPPARKDKLWFIALICEVPLAKDWLTFPPHDRDMAER